MSARQKILVTGGAGYIGSHTCIALIEAGYLPFIADNFSNSDLSVIDRLREITGEEILFDTCELTSLSQTRKLFEKHGPFEGVIHFAALKSVGESVQQPLRYFRNNLYSLITVLECMQEFACPKIIFSSSCTVYGDPDKLPVTEQTPIKDAASPYGSTKQLGEEILKQASANTSLRAVALRYFNPIGAHASGKIGEKPSGIPNNLLPYLTAAVSGKLPQLQVFGDDYNTQDGSCVRDYIHVCDLAEAHVSALAYAPPAGESFSAFNVGTGNGYSVLEVIRTFMDVTGEKVPYKIADRRPGDVPAIWSDPALGEKKLGWKAKRGLAEMLEDAWRWEKNLE